MKMTRTVLVAIIGILVLFERGFPQWSTDPSQNLKVAGGGINPEICIDGNGGCFIVWETGAAGNRRLLRMQHLNRYGYKSFPEAGISLASEEFDQSTPFFLTYGGASTVIVLFYDTRFINGQWVARTLVQRVDTAGTRLCGETAVRVAQTDFTQSPTSLLIDDKGGTFVFWAEDRDGDGLQEMLGNRISFNGQREWGQNGKKFAKYPFNTNTQAVLDGAGGLYISHTDSNALVIHRLDENGQFVWPTSRAMPIGAWGRLASDNAGGFFWAAHEQIAYRPPAGVIYRTRVFRYNQAGESLWPAEGVAITDSAYGQTFTPEVLVNAREDVALIYRALSGRHDNLYVQRLNFAGELLFEFGGIPVSLSLSSQAFNRTSLSYNANLIVAWLDGRTTDGNIYVQSIDTNGNQDWNEDVPITLRPDFERNHRTCSDGNGGCIVTWYEIGTGSGWGIFAQQISRNGKLGEVITTSVDWPHSEQQSSSIPLSFSSFPNPFLDTVQFRLKISVNLHIIVQVFDLTGRIVTEFHNSPVKDGNLNLRWDGKDQHGKILPSGIYVVKATAGKHVAGQKVILIR